VARPRLLLFAVLVICVGAVAPVGIVQAQDTTVITVDVADRIVLGQRVRVPVTIDCSKAPAGAFWEGSPVVITQVTGGNTVYSYGGAGAGDCSETPVTVVAMLDSPGLRPGLAVVDVYYGASVCDVDDQGQTICEGIGGGTYQETIMLVGAREGPKPPGA
jgi:hypothetical protein